MDEIESREESMRHLEQRRQAAADDDSRLRNDFLAKLAEDDRLSQLADQRRRLLLLDHRRAVDKFVAEKRQQREEEWKQAQLELARQQKEDENRARVIEDEYQK